MNGVQTRFKCKLDVKRCKRFVFPPSSLLPRSNALKTKAIRYFQTDRTLTRIVSPPLSELIRQTAGTAFDMWQKFAFTFVLVASFVLLYQRDRFKNFVSNLRYYGRMSLTNYITQSIAGAIIYFPFGLYLAPYCGYTLSLLVGFVLFLLQVQFCKWWLKGHKQGPLESLWHKWTWMYSKK